MEREQYRYILAELRQLNERMKLMAIDTTKIVASEARLIANVEALRADAKSVKATLVTVQQQLADAIAANDPAALKAVQDTLDGLVTGMDAESSAVEADEAPAPTGTTGPTGP